MIESVLHQIGDVLAALMVIPLVIFIVYYAVKSAWRSDPIGIALMLQKLVLVLLVIDLVLANYLPSALELVFLIVRLVIFGTVLTLITVDVVNLRRIQTGSKRPLFLAWFRKDYTKRPRRKGFYNTGH